MVGIGIGWLEEEFQAMGIAWARRADRTRDYVAAMRRLWGDEVSAFNGEFARFANVRSFPKPVAGERLPVVVGWQYIAGAAPRGRVWQRMVRPESQPGSRPPKS